MEVCVKTVSVGINFLKNIFVFETDTSNERVIIGTYMERVWLLQLLRV